MYDRFPYVAMKFDANRLIPPASLNGRVYHNVTLPVCFTTFSTFTPSQLYNCEEY